MPLVSSVNLEGIRKQKTYKVEFGDQPGPTVFPSSLPLGLRNKNS